jgi:hypothetical protein
MPKFTQEKYEDMLPAARAVAAACVRLWDAMQQFEIEYGHEVEYEHAIQLSAFACDADEAERMDLDWLRACVEAPEWQETPAIDEEGGVA